jgi:hypothetical protein
MGAPRVILVTGALAIALAGRPALPAEDEGAGALVGGGGAAGGAAGMSEEFVVPGVHVPVHIYWRGPDPRDARVRMCALNWVGHHETPPGEAWGGGGRGRGGGYG